MDTLHQKKRKRTIFFILFFLVILSLGYMVIAPGSSQGRNITIRQNEGMIEYTRGSFISNVTLQVNLSGILLPVNSHLFAIQVDDTHFKFGWERIFASPFAASNRNIEGKYIIEANKDIDLQGNIITQEDNYIAFHDLCDPQTHQDCSRGTYANGTAMECATVIDFDPQCRFQQTSRNQVTIDFSILYDAPTRRMVIDPIFGVSNDEVILKDDFSNTSGVMSSGESIEYGLSGWSGTMCSWTGTGYTNCTGLKSMTAQIFPPDPTVTCKMNSYATDSATNGTSQFTFRNDTSGDLKCQTLNRGGDLNYRIDSNYSIFMPNIDNATEYTTYMTYHAGNNTCDYFAMNTLDNSINATIDGAAAIQGTSQGFGTVYVTNDVNNQESTAVDYVFCWNGTRSTDPSAAVFTDFIEDPLNGSLYGLSELHIFNATLNQPNVDEVWIVFNETNYSKGGSEISSLNNIWTFNTSNLSAAQYNYTWYMNDTADVFYSGDMQTYEVLQAVPTMDLVLNGGRINITNGTLGMEINVTAEKLNGENNIELYLDGALINTGIGLLSNLTTITSTTTMNFTAVYISSENFTGNFTSLFVDVSDFIKTVVNPEYPTIIDSSFIISLEANNSFTGENITRMELNVEQPNGTLIADNETMVCVELSEQSHQLCNTTITHEKTISSVGTWKYNATVWEDGGENSSFIQDVTFIVELPLSIDIFSPVNTTDVTTLTPTLNFTVGQGDYCSPSCFDTCLYNITRGASTEVATTSITCNTNVALSLSSDATTYLLTTFVNDTNGNENSTTLSFTTNLGGGGVGGSSGGGGGSNIVTVGTGSTGNCDVTIPEKIELSLQTPLQQMRIINNQDSAISTLISKESPVGLFEPDGKKYLLFPSQNLQPILPGQFIDIALELDVDAIIIDNITTNQFARVRIPGGGGCEKFVLVEMNVGRGIDFITLLRASTTGLLVYPNNTIIGGMILLAIGLLFLVPGLKNLKIISKILFVFLFAVFTTILILIFTTLFIT